MAGDWIPMRIHLDQDPAVISIAARLGIDESTVVGKLHRIWGWANEHTTDGNAHGVTKEWIDRYLGVPNFADAMLQVDWLQVRNGSIIIPKFDVWNSQSAKKRALTAKRVAKHKEGKSNARSVSDALPKEEKRRDNTLPASPKKEKPKKARPPNLLFDAITAITQSDPHTCGSRIGKACSILAGAEPPYSPEEVFAFAERFWHYCSWAERESRRTPTIGEVEKYIHKVRNQATEPSGDTGFKPDLEYHKTLSGKP